MEQRKGGRELGSIRDSWRAQAQHTRAANIDDSGRLGPHSGRNGHFGKTNSLPVRAPVSELILSLAPKEREMPEARIRIPAMSHLSRFGLAVFMGSALTPG